MTKLSLVLAVLAAAVPVAYSQTPGPPITCTLATPTPPSAPANGESELVNDVYLTCTTNEFSQSITIDVELFLNTNLTSRITDTATMSTEALLLIDDPLPGVANTSNGFPYFGQVLGTPGILAGAAGSGNVYQGTQVPATGGGVLANVVEFVGVPYVTGGTRTFRITNIRANVGLLGVNPVEALVQITTDIAVGVTNPEVPVANGANALNFTSGPLIGAIGLNLSFAERFPNAFKKRDENTTGPLTLAYQDVPGTPYCTQSGFTPEFVSLTPGAIGLADTGTRLFTSITNIPPGAFVLIVPDRVVSSSGELVAHRVLPPFATNFSGGTVTTSSGDGLVLVSASHTAELLYEVTAAAPFLGVNGCGVLDTFNIGVFPLFPVPMTSAVVTGELAPLDPTAQASATAPEPRFLP
jgi:hypothetical protein